MSDPNQPMSTDQLMAMLGSQGPPQAQYPQQPPMAPQYPQQAVPQYPQQPPMAPQYPQQAPPQYPQQAPPQYPQQPPMAPQYPPVPGMQLQLPPVNPPGEYQTQGVPPGLPQSEPEPGKRKRRTKAELAQAGGATSNVTLGGQSYEITILITPVS